MKYLLRTLGPYSWVTLGMFAAAGVIWLVVAL